MRLVKILYISILFISTASYGQDTVVWSLRKCVDYALQNNLNVQRSKLVSENTELGYKQAKLAFLPDLNGNSSYGINYGRSIDPTTNQFVDQTIRSANFNASSSLPIFQGLTIQNSLKQNRVEFEASKKNLEVSKNDVILNVVSFYINVLFAKEQLENAKQQLATSEKQTKRTQIQVEAGSLPKSDLLDIQAQNATNAFNLVSQENAVRNAKLQLKQAMQLPPEEMVEIDVPDLDVDADLVQELSAYEIYQIALNNMPEIEAADLNVESSEIGVKIAKGRLYPTLGLSANISTNYSDLFSSRQISRGSEVITQPIGYVDINGLQQPVYADITQPIYSTEPYGFNEQFNGNLSKSIGVGINIPVFNGFSARYDVQRAKISNEQAEIDKKETRYNLWQTIEQSYNDVISSAKSYSASKSQLDARQESYRVIKIRYDNGDANFVDYQVSESQFFQAQSDLVRAKYDLIFKQKVLDFYQGKTIEF